MGNQEGRHERCIAVEFANEKTKIENYTAWLAGSVDSRKEDSKERHSGATVLATRYRRNRKKGKADQMARNFVEKIVEGTNVTYCRNVLSSLLFFSLTIEIKFSILSHSCQYKKSLPPSSLFLIISTPSLNVYTTIDWSSL